LRLISFESSHFSGLHIFGLLESPNTPAG